MAKMSKTQARKRLNEAYKKCFNVSIYYGAENLSNAQFKKLDIILIELRKIVRQLK